MALSLTQLLEYFPDALRALIVDPGISDININAGEPGDERIFFERDGIYAPAAGVFITEDNLEDAAKRIVRQQGGDLSAQSPTYDSTLTDGSRVAVIYDVATPRGLTMSIRKFTWYTDDHLIAMGSLPEYFRDIILDAMLRKQNILLSGATGSGKTVQLNSLLRRLPLTDRLIVIEKPMEFDLVHKNVQRLQAVDAGPYQVAVSIGFLVKTALRHNPSRIIIGELRDDEAAFHFLEAMNTGHSGVASTIHANSAIDALDRISEMASLRYGNIPHSYMRRKTSRCITYVMHIEKDASTGKRRATELIEVLGYDQKADEFLTRAIHGTPSDHQLHAVACA